MNRFTSNKRWLSRLIDIDTLFFNDTIIKSYKITIPHYDIRKRDFFLLPLLEICDKFFNPHHSLYSIALTYLIKKKSSICNLLNLKRYFV